MRPAASQAEVEAGVRRTLIHRDAQRPATAAGQQARPCTTKTPISARTRVQVAGTIMPALHRRRRSGRTNAPLSFPRFDGAVPAFLLHVTVARLADNQAIPSRGNSRLAASGAFRCSGKPVWRTVQDQLDAFYSFGACLSVAS